MNKYLTFSTNETEVEIFKSNTGNAGYFLSIGPKGYKSGDDERAIYLSADEMLDVLESFANFVRESEDMAISDDPLEQSGKKETM